MEYLELGDMKYKIEFAYDGTNYFGYAKQKGKTTIQSTLEKILFKITQEKISIYASGRTDKGVHAVKQVADFVLAKNVDIIKLKTSLNKLLPNDIYIKNIEIADDNFSSRLSAKEKHYLYIINYGDYDLFKRNYELYQTNLDFNLIEEASKLFIGKHNFKNFSSKEEDNDNFIREIFDISFKYENNRCYIIFKGNGFMRYQVRKMVQTLIEIGKGKITKEYINTYLNKKERDIVSYTAEPHALYLYDVIY